MKISLIILSIVLAIVTGLLIWKSIESKKAKEKNKVLDPTDAVSTKTVNQLTTNAGNPAVDSQNAVITPEASGEIATARMNSARAFGV